MDDNVPDLTKECTYGAFSFHSAPNPTTPIQCAKFRGENWPRAVKTEFGQLKYDWICKYMYYLTIY